MSDIFSSPSNMEALMALGPEDIGHNDFVNAFDHQPPSYQSFEMFRSHSLAPLPYTCNENDDETATFISGANLGHVDMPKDLMDLPNRLSTLDSSSQTFQPGGMVPTSYVSNDVAPSIVTQSDAPRVWATDHDWTRHRALITELYGENKLSKVMSIMENQHGFKATVKMYKTHIAKWGLDKKNKEPEMRAIVRKSKQRAEQGKRSNFLVRKRQLKFAEVVRYWQRKGVNIDEVIARSIASPTPEAVECFTPVSFPITPPEDLATPEYILRIIRGYIAASFESGTWVKTDPRSECYSIKDGGEAGSLSDFSDLCCLAVRLFSTCNLVEAEKTLSAVSAISGRMLIAEHPGILMVLLSRIASMQRKHNQEIALRILRQLSAISKELLSESHPLGLFCAWLIAMPWSQIEDVISRCFIVMIDDFESLVGPMHASTLNCRLSLNRLDPNLAITRRMLDQCESALESYDERTLDIRTRLIYYTFSKGKYVEAKRMAEDLYAFVQRNRKRVKSDWFSALSHKYIAICQFALSQPHSAIQNLELAVHLQTMQYGAQDGSVRNWLFTLEQWYTRQGQLNEAIAARDRRIKVLKSTDIAYQDL